MDVLVKICNVRNTSMQGLDITIENHAGELRHGDKWIQKMAHDYGYINGTMGADGDEMDVFVGPNPDADNLYIVEQQDDNGDFDEHKVMAGFSNMAEAKDAYHANYPEGWDGLKNISELPVDEFWGWHDGLAGYQNSNDEIFIRELKTKEKANPTRHITEDEFPKKEGMIVVYKPYGSQGKGYYYVPGKNRWDSIVVTKEMKDKRAKLVRDEEGYAGRPDFSNKKENAMDRTLEDTYHVGTHNREELISRGKHTYGSKVDNSVCECKVCYGGGKRGLFACKNCNGTGKVKNNSKAEKIMHIDTSILDKYGSRSGRDLEKYRDEFLQEVRAAGINDISQEDADELEDQNYHTALGILMEARFLKRMKNSKLSDGADSLKETDSGSNPGQEGASHVGPFFEPGDATHRQDGDEIMHHNRAGVFKKGDHVIDYEGNRCRIVGEAQSGEYYVVEYPDGTQSRMRELDLTEDDVSKENEKEQVLKVGSKCHIIQGEDGRYYLKENGTEKQIMYADNYTFAKEAFEEYNKTGKWE